MKDLRVKLLLWPVSNHWCQDFYFNLPLFYLITVKCAGWGMARDRLRPLVVVLLFTRSTQFFSRVQANQCSRSEEIMLLSLCRQAKNMTFGQSRTLKGYFFSEHTWTQRSEELFAYQLTSIKSLIVTRNHLIFGICLTKERVRPRSWNKIELKFFIDFSPIWYRPERLYSLNLCVMREFCNWSRHDKSPCNLADLVWSTSVFCGSV